MVDSWLQVSGMKSSSIWFSGLSVSLCLISSVIFVFVQDVANIAQWDDEQIEYVKEKVTEEGRQEDLKKGKAPAQVLYSVNYLSISFTDRVYADIHLNRAFIFKSIAGCIRWSCFLVGFGFYRGRMGWVFGADCQMLRGSGTSWCRKIHTL